MGRSTAGHDKSDPLGGSPDPDEDKAYQFR